MGERYHHPEERRISGQEVESFSARLNRELDVLDWKTKNELLVKIGRMELRMKASIGIDGRPIWRGPLSEDKMLGQDVVVSTEQGERRGRVICFGVVHVGGDDWERSVIIHSPASGTQHEVPGSLTRLATPGDVERLKNELVMAERLVEASDAVQKGAVSPARSRPRRKGQHDPELVRELHTLALASESVTSVEEGRANYKISGPSGKRIYLFKDQLRVDLSGFTVDHPGVRKISDEEARDMHLGKVRGQLLFDDRSIAKAAFEVALAALA